MFEELSFSAESGRRRDLTTKIFVGEFCFSALVSNYDNRANFNMNAAYTSSKPSPQSDHFTNSYMYKKVKTSNN